MPEQGGDVKRGVGGVAERPFVAYNSMSGFSGVEYEQRKENYFLPGIVLLFNPGWLPDKYSRGSI